VLYNRGSDDARIAHVMDLEQRLIDAGPNPEILTDRKIGSRVRARGSSR